VEVPAQGRRLPAEMLINNLLDSLKGGRVQSIVIPEAVSASYQITVGKAEKNKAEGDHKDHKEHQADNSKRKESKENPPKANGEKKDGASGGRPQRGTTYFVNPYSGNVLGTGETSSSAFFMSMFRLHRWLLLDMEIGRPIVGVATIIFVVIIISGLVIWFPKKIKNWKQGVSIKTSANWKRVNHDLHNSLGLYSSIFLLIMALTGLTWSFEWYKTGFNNVLGVSSERKSSKVQSKVKSSSTKASIEECLLNAGKILPYGGDYRIMLPTDSSGTVVVMKTGNSFFATSSADRLSLDQYSAEVLSQELFSEKPFNEQVVASVKALHVGSVYGTFSKIIYFIACLIGTSLPVTGVIIWINKLRKPKKKPAFTKAKAGKSNHIGKDPILDGMLK
jgi:uncharacterized iron-regulated membrane protein